MSASILKVVLPGKLDIKRHSPSILFIYEADMEKRKIDNIHSEIAYGHYCAEPSSRVKSGKFRQSA